MPSTTGAPWNIPFPVTGDGLPPLEGKFAAQASALHAALDQLAKVATPIVGSAGARDALFPTPIHGNAVYRTDLGYVERYYNNTAVFPATGWMRDGGDTGWLAPSMLNGWSSVADQAAQYRRVGNVLHMRGRIKGTSNAVAFVLPVGFRPGTDRVFSAMQGGGNPATFVRVLLNTNGQVNGIANSEPNLHDIPPILLD